jgi:hypothetical protein
MRPRSIILPSRKIAERSQCNLDPMIWTWKLERKSVHLRSRCFLDSFQINTGTTQHFDNFRQARVLSITEKRPVNCSDERMPSTAASISCITFSAGWTDSMMDPYDADWRSIQNASSAPDLCGRIEYLVIFLFEDQATAALHCTSVDDSTVSIKDLSVYLSSEDLSVGSLHCTSVNSLNQGLVGPRVKTPLEAVWMMRQTSQLHQQAEITKQKTTAAI